MTTGKNQGETNDLYVKVAGAGTGGVNGDYYPTEETYNGVEVYCQCGSFQDREDGSFLIWRYEKNYWCISTLPKGEKLWGNEVDYYICRTQKKSETPPEGEWERFKKGIDPPPKITVVAKDTAIDIISINSKMLFSEKFSDVHFHCPDGTILHAHKIFLSGSSSYFAAVFEGPWGDEHPDGVWKTSNSADLMRIFLKYLYTQKCDDHDISKDPLGLLSLAHEYDLMPLLQIAKRKLVEEIGKDNVKEFLLAAALYDLMDVKESCFECISANASDLLKDDDFIKLSFEDKALWNELISFIFKDK